MRYLHKIYGRPGPIGRAWRSTERYLEKHPEGERAKDARDEAKRLAAALDTNSFFDGSGINLNPVFRIGLAAALFVVSALIGAYLYRHFRHGRSLDREIDIDLGEPAPPAGTSGGRPPPRRALHQEVQRHPGPAHHRALGAGPGRGWRGALPAGTGPGELEPASGRRACEP